MQQNAGKSGGEFFTPQHVSKLIAQLAMHKQTKVNKIYRHSSRIWLFAYYKQKNILIIIL
jgi:hypothetical protein